MILDPIEQHVFQKAKYSTIPYIDDSETESESTSKDDALDDILSINDEEVEEFDRFFLLSSPEDDAKSFQVRFYFYPILKTRQRVSCKHITEEIFFRFKLLVSNNSTLTSQA